MKYLIKQVLYKIIDIFNILIKRPDLLHGIIIIVHNMHWYCLIHEGLVLLTSARDIAVESVMHAAVE